MFTEQRGCQSAQNHHLSMDSNLHVSHWGGGGGGGLNAVLLVPKLRPRSWERSGSVVECLTRDRGAAGSSLTGVTALWSLSKTHLS